MTSFVRCFVAVVLLGTLGTAHKPSSENKHFQCTKEGRFEDSSDCGSFIDCVPSKNGGFDHKHGSCRGQAYDPLIKGCVELQKVQGCKPRKARSLASDPKLAYICEGITSEFVCSDCKTLVNCVNGTAFPEPCGQGDFCASKKEDFGGGVCYPNEPQECTCDKPKSFKIDIYDDSHFLFCEEEASDPLIYQCPEDHFFDPESSQCRNFEGLPECEKIGVFADARNCTTFYTCIYTKSGWVQKPFSCNNETHTGLMFNEGTGRCEDPCEWDDGQFVCEAEGRFPDPLSCQRYYECIEDPESGDFRQVLHECPEEYIWDPNARNDFGHCVLPGSSQHPCSPHKPEKCYIPEDLCEIATPDPTDPLIGLSNTIV